MRSRAISIKATPIMIRPTCFRVGVSDLRKRRPPTKSISGANQRMSRLRNSITNAEPRSAPRIAASPSSKEIIEELKSPDTIIATAKEDCMIAASRAPKTVAVTLA